MSTVTLEEARVNLHAILAGLPAGDEVVITDGTGAVAKLVAVQPPPAPQPRVPGSAVGILTILTDDDDHLRAFDEAAG